MRRLSGIRISHLSMTVLVLSLAFGCHSYVAPRQELADEQKVVRRERATFRHLGRKWMTEAAQVVKTSGELLILSEYVPYLLWRLGRAP